MFLGIKGYKWELLHSLLITLSDSPGTHLLPIPLTLGSAYLEFLVATGGIFFTRRHNSDSFHCTGSWDCQQAAFSNSCLSVNRQGGWLYSPEGLTCLPRERRAAPTQRMSGRVCLENREPLGHLCAPRFREVIKSCDNPIRAASGQVLQESTFGSPGKESQPAEVFAEGKRNVE